MITPAMVIKYRNSLLNLIRYEFKQNHLLKSKRFCQNEKSKAKATEGTPDK